MTTLKHVFNKLVEDSAAGRAELACQQWVDVALADVPAKDIVRNNLGWFSRIVQNRALQATAACLLFVVACGAGYRIYDLQLQIKESGVREAMHASISGSGRNSIEIVGSYDSKYIVGAAVRIGERLESLEPDTRSPGDNKRHSFARRIVVPLDGKRFTVAVEFEPKEGLQEELPEFFSDEKVRRERRFLASVSGLITDPQEIESPAELEQIVYMPDRKDLSRDQNLYVVAGQTYDQVVGMHGWLIIEPLLAPNKTVGSRLSFDAVGGASANTRFIAKCYLGTDQLDGQAYRVFCAFSRDANALTVTRELAEDFDWSPFVVTAKRYKINDGDDGFDEELRKQNDQP